MPLESTVVCLDTSAWMINGDYIPNRLEAQQDAAGLLCTFKLEANVESTVGLLTHGGKRVRVLMPPTDDESALHACLDGLKAGGATNVVQGIKIAMLALKHRRNKNGGQRIIVFVGSPITEKDKVLKKLGIDLRRGNISLDVVGLGEHEANADKIKVLVDAANTDENNCSYAPIPEGVPPSDALMTSSILTGVAGGAAGGAGAGAFAQYGGVNPELDPELAMTIAASLEHARQTTQARDEASKATDAAAGAGDGGDAAATPAATSNADREAPAAPGPAASGAMMDLDDDDDPELRMAMMMSLMEDAGAPAPSPAPAPAAAPTPAPVPAPAAADTGAAAPAAATAAADGGDEVTEDFVMSMLSDLPGVDQNDPTIQEMLAQMRGGGDGDAEGDDADGADNNSK